MDSAEYAPIEGTPEFVQAAIDAAFQEYKPNAYIDGFATRAAQVVFTTRCTIIWKMVTPF